MSVILLALLKKNERATENELLSIRKVLRSHDPTRIYHNYFQNLFNGLKAFYTPPQTLADSIG